MGNPGIEKGEERAVNESILAFKYNILVDALFESAKMGYYNKSFTFTGEDRISTILDICEPERFREVFDRLTAEKNREGEAQ